MAGDVLEHRQHAARHQALGHGGGDGGDLLRRFAIGAVADDGIGAGDRHIGERQAVDVDPKRLEIGRDQPGAEPGGGKAGRRVAVVEPAIGRAGRIGRPVRRSEPLHPAALLVDQDGRLSAEFK